MGNACSSSAGAVTIPKEDIVNKPKKFVGKTSSPNGKNLKDQGQGDKTESSKQSTEKAKEDCLNASPSVPAANKTPIVQSESDASEAGAIDGHGETAAVTACEKEQSVKEEEEVQYLQLNEYGFLGSVPVGQSPEDWYADAAEQAEKDKESFTVWSRILEIGLSVGVR